MFDSRDAFPDVNGSVTDATPTNGLTSDGAWNRDDYHNGGASFDADLIVFLKKPTSEPKP
jgi:hypothetical protein